MYILVSVFISCCCGAEKADQTGQGLFSVTDLAGRNISFRDYPKRIISLAPSNTEIIFALGAGKKIAGRTSFCDYPPEASSVPSIGDLGNPDRELVLSLDPDCVAASNKTQANIIDFFNRHNIPVIITEATSFDEISESIRLLGKITETTEQAEQIASSLQSEAKEIAAHLKGVSRVPCYFAVAFGQYGNWTAGPGSFLHEIIEMAGGKNLGAVIGKPWGEISPETILSLNPEVLILGKHSGPVDQLGSAAGIRDIDAVKKNRIIIVDDNLIGRPGPRIIGGLRELAEKLHPDVFEKQDEKQ